MNTVRTAGRLFFGACLTAAFATAGAAESAATLVQTDGMAIVSDGAQYVAAHEGMRLSEGDRLMVMEGGSAVIRFADGCQYTLADDEFFTIGSESACASTTVGSHKVDPYSAMSQDSGAAGVAYQQASTGVSGGGAAAEEVGSLAWVVPAAGAAVLIAAVASDTGSNNNKKAQDISP
jgi:hypothetical protein